MTTICYSTTHDAIDWARLKDDLAADQFDNGRTAVQLERSFRGSFRCVYALEGTLTVGTARALSDGVCNAYVVDLWSHSEYRRRGVGRRLLDLLCEPFEGQHIFLFTDEHESFYAACGFEPRGTGMQRVIGTWLKNASAE